MFAEYHLILKYNYIKPLFINIIFCCTQIKEIDKTKEANITMITKQHVSSTENI